MQKKREGSRWLRSMWLSSSPTNTLKKKNHLHVERFTQKIYWVLAEELKPPQRARNPPHNWIEQKKKGEREGEKRHQDETSILETEPRKRKGTHSLGSYLANRDQPRRRDHKIAEKSAAAGLRRAKQNESHTDHLYHRLGHHSLRPLVGVGCWDSPRRPQMRKARRMCGLIGEVRCRCWGRQEGWSAIGISFPVHM